MWTIPQPITSLQEHISLERYLWQTLVFFGSQYFVPDNFNVDPYIYIRSIGNNGNTFNQWAKIKVTIIT